jgi:hypothetical protein
VGEREKEREREGERERERERERPLLITFHIGGLRRRPLTDSAPP